MLANTSAIRRIRGFAATAAILAISAFPGASIARAESAVNNWYLNGNYNLSFTLEGFDYNHTLVIDSFNHDNGSFVGHGWFIDNPALTWSANGNIVDSNIAFIINYTGINPGYTLNVMGTIADDGSMSGTATSNINQSFTWRSTSGVALPGDEDNDNDQDENNDEDAEEQGQRPQNHGFYVSDSDDRRETAHTRLGMPTLSQGHLYGQGNDN